MTTPQPMPLVDLFRDFTNGDATGWDEERRWLRAMHPNRIINLVKSLRTYGFDPDKPIRLCFNERRVIDGHHRIVAAEHAGLTHVLVADAWDGSDWSERTPDAAIPHGADDPQCQAEWIGEAGAWTACPCPNCTEGTPR